MNKIFYYLSGFFIVLSLSGCYSGYKLTKGTGDYKKVNKAYNVDAETSYPVFISSINVRGNDVNQGFERRVVAKINDTGLFKEVIYGFYSRKPEPPYIDAKLDVSESMNDHAGSNAAKGFFIGASLWLLTPALPLNYDYTTEFDLDVVWPNNQRRSYKAECAGEAWGTLDQARNALAKLPGEVTEACLTSIANQMGADFNIMKSTFIGKK